nr:MAG: ORF1 [TTV-like mini virus]
MPPFYRRPWTRWRRRRRPFWTRRPRQTFRRRFHRRRWVRRRRFFRKYRLYRKKTKIHITQFQPKSIKKCKIKGALCLLTCGRNRQNHNYTLTSESYVPTEEPGGGGWSIMQLTLRALYDELLHNRNWWTGSNVNKPLVRYLGCTFKFYRSKHTDYIVSISLCPPFEVTALDYLNTQPSLHLMNKNKIIVPRLDRTWTKRAYVKRKFKPPSMLSNKWFLQTSLYNTPLIMIKTSACDLDQPYGPEDQISTNITLISLNLDLFQNTNWETDQTQGYYPKIEGTYSTALYASNHNNPTDWQHLTLLANTTNALAQGKPLPNTINTYITTSDKKQYWGNPFNPHFHTGTYKFYFGKSPESYNQGTQKPEITEATSLFEQIRYNPFKDKGSGNQIYIKSTHDPRSSFITPPTDTRLILEGKPLWQLTWAYTDWITKTKLIQHLHEEYQVVIKSEYLYPKRRGYLFLDKYFYDQQNIEQLTETDRAHWHPKTEFQEEALAAIAITGPFSPKINLVKQIQCHCFYNFFFKWGGCPSTIEEITDPSKQETFPIPNNQLQTVEIIDPNTPEQYSLWEWDTRRDTLTDRAAKRIKDHYESPTSFTEFGAKDPPRKKQKEERDTSPQKKSQTPQEQLQQLKQYQQQLRLRLNNLLANLE